MRSGSQVGFFLRLALFLFYFRWLCGVPGERCRDIEREDGVATLGGAVLHNILPLLLVIIFLLLGPGLAGGVINRLRIGRPGEGVNVFFSLRDLNGFAAVGRNQVELAGGFIFRVGIGVGIVPLPSGLLALREKRDPFAVGRPLRIGVVTGLRQLDQRAP